MTPMHFSYKMESLCAFRMFEAWSYYQYSLLSSILNVKGQDYHHNSWIDTVKPPRKGHFGTNINSSGFSPV